MAQKIDFKKEYKELYRQPANKISYVEVPEFNYLAIDGEGHPEGNQDFQHKIGTLYGIAYTLKFMLKEPGLQPAGYFDFVVPPLETFWFMKNDVEFDANKPDDWCWTLMIMQADYISTELVEMANKELIKKGKEVKFLDQLRLEKISDGKAVQTLHVGPYNEVRPTVKMLLDELENNDLKPARKYREIYLNDPRRIAPEKIKTICRMPYVPI